MKTLCKTTEDHVYIFRYSSGSEDDVIEQIMYTADDTESGLSWTDAAELCLQAAGVSS